MTKEQIVEAINTAWEAVDESRAGPLIVGQMPNGEKLWSNVALQTFYGILANTIEKTIINKGTLDTTTHIKTAKEPWQSED